MIRFEFEIRSEACSRLTGQSREVDRKGMYEIHNEKVVFHDKKGHVIPREYIPSFGWIPDYLTQEGRWVYRRDIVDGKTGKVSHEYIEECSHGVREYDDSGYSYRRP